MGVDQTFPSERVGRVLGQLQAEVENFVLKMAAQFQQRREQLIFLINNYDMMLAVLVVRSGQSPVVPAQGLHRETTSLCPWVQRLTYILLYRIHSRIPTYVHMFIYAPAHTQRQTYIKTDKQPESDLETYKEQNTDMLT